MTDDGRGASADAGADAGAEQVAAVRRFNRFYTRQIGVLEEGLLESPFSLTEARVLFELAHQEATTATELAELLGLDAGYLSRLLKGFVTRGLVRRGRSGADRRRLLLSLTDRGRGAFSRLDEASRVEVEGLLAGLGEGERSRLVGAMETIETVLGPAPAGGVPYILRPPRSGDLGWVVQRHGELYAREYGWNEDFEALVAEIVSRYARDHDAKRERCWIAEREGTNVGSVFLVRDPERASGAKLRLLLVEPSARGLGIGRRLVAECTAFARGAGYDRIRLWTNGVLTAARRLYEAEGYRLVEEERHHSFGHDLVGETWELELGGG